MTTGDEEPGTCVFGKTCIFGGCSPECCITGDEPCLFAAGGDTPAVTQAQATTIAGRLKLHGKTPKK